MAEASAAADAPAPAHHRRQVLVDRGFQLKYALLMAGAGLVVAVVFGLWLHQAHAQAIALLAPDPETRALVARRDRDLLAVFAAIARSSRARSGSSASSSPTAWRVRCSSWATTCACSPRAASRGCGRSAGATSSRPSSGPSSTRSRR